MKKDLMKDNTSERRYGDDQTVHRTDNLDVEVAADGKVVAVWFRCQPLKFKQSVANQARANDMTEMYKGEMSPIKAVVLEGNTQIERKI